MYVGEVIAPAVEKIREQGAAEHVEKKWLYHGDYIASHEQLEAALRAEFDLPPDRSIDDYIHSQPSMTL